MLRRSRMCRAHWFLFAVLAACTAVASAFAQSPAETTLEQALRVPPPPSAVPDQLPPTARLPVPPDAAQAESLSLVREVYKADYDKAKSVVDRQALARKMLALAAETRDDPAGQFVLLKLTRDIAAQAGDGQTAIQAVDAMAKTFQVDAVVMKTDVLAVLAKRARQSAEHKAIVEQAARLIDQAVAADKFELAETLGAMGLASAKQSGATPLTKQLRSRIAEVKEIAEAYEQVKAAAATLDAKPTDPEANLIVGRYKCFVKGDWDTGLLMLALGTDPALATLAVKELEGAKSADEQVKLGDSWWALADKQDGAAKGQIQGRAGIWYKQALPWLTGLRKGRAEKRLKEAPELPRLM